MSLLRASWNTGLLFHKNSWHLQKFGSAEKWVISPQKRKILGGGRKREKELLGKIKPFLFFIFSSSGEQRNSCLCLLRIPPATSWAASNPSKLLPALGLLWLCASRGRAEPQLGLGGTILMEASPRACGEPALPQTTFFCSPTSLLSPSHILGKTLFCWKIPHEPFLIYMRVTQICYFKKRVWFIWRERKKKPINANHHMVVLKLWASLFVCRDRPRWQHSCTVNGIVLRCWKKQLKMTGSLLCPKWQHLNTQYAQRWLSQGNVMICETNFY